MKKLAILYIAVVLLFALLILVANLVFNSLAKKQEETNNILMNRIVEGFSQEYLFVPYTRSAVFPYEEKNDPEFNNMQSDLDTYMEENRDAFIKEYGKAALPDNVLYISSNEGETGVSLINKDNTSDKVWALRPINIKTGEQSIVGFIVFEYKDAEYSNLQKLMNITLAAAFIIALGICIYISSTVLRPFEKLSDYPEKLSKNEISEKLPETKNRLFGRFIWGVNMLSDNIQNKQKKVDELSRDQMTMLTTIAHGIKTPVANIKLYADAISTGLYQENGEINKSDAEIAGKISKNADDITEIVKELIDKTSGTVVDFEPDIRPFYLKELVDFLEEEYSNRLNVLSIPFDFEMNHNAMVKSDKRGICRILSQIMENAIKYGNGEGINVNLNKEEDGYYFVIRNKGNVLSEKELPYIFNSFWRGSNAEKVGGNGIGLFEAKKIAQCLYGDIYVKANSEENEMEFDIYIPDNI